MIFSSQVTDEMREEASEKRSQGMGAMSEGLKW